MFSQNLHAQTSGLVALVCSARRLGLLVFTVRCIYCHQRVAVPVPIFYKGITFVDIIILLLESCPESRDKMKAKLEPEDN